jgi:hypothetical protein
VTGVIVGARSPREIEVSITGLTSDVSESVWRELEAVGPVCTGEAKQ